MTLIAVTSAKGSPGVTLTSLGLVAAWPTGDSGRKVLVEADPSGGSLAIRFGLGRQPGLISLAAAAGHGLAADDLWSQVQALPGGVGVVLAPERGDRARSVLAGSSQTIGRWLTGRGDVVTIADCGRYTPGDLASGLVEAADLVLLVARPTAEQIQPATAVAQHLVSLGVEVRWVLIGDRPHSAAEVEQATSVPVERVLPDDPRGALAVAAGDVGSRRANRLVRYFTTWASELSTRITAPTEVPEPVKGSEPLQEAVVS